MNKYEQLIEHIINDNEQAARELFHQIVVEKSRDIYESLMDEEQIDEVGGNPAADFVNDITDEVRADETEGLGEDDDMDDDSEMDLDDMSDEDAEDDHHADMGGNDAVEDRILDLETELDELKAEFDKLMGGGDQAASDDGFGADDMGDDMGDDMDDDMGDEDPMMMEADDELDEEEELDEDDDVQESRYNKSQSEVMKEYVEKVKDLFKGEPGEGQEVAKGGSVNVNKGSVVAGKNDMGGTTSNITKGGSESNPDGQKPHGKAGGFVKPAQEIDVAKRNVNKPGGNKGAQKFYGNKAKADHAEGATTGDSVKVHKDSLLGK